MFVEYSNIVTGFKEDPVFVTKNSIISCKSCQVKFYVKGKVKLKGKGQGQGEGSRLR